MTYASDIHHRHSIRLKGYDYSHSGAYFITICTQNRACLFGDVVDGEMRLNEYGHIAKESWLWISRQYEYVNNDEWIVMPNHLHGILIITNNCRGGSRTAPTEINKQKTLGRLIGAFKTVSSKHINQSRNTPGHPVWQRNYYEHIIRNEQDLHRIQQYIIDNPAKWVDDENNPGNIVNRKGEKFFAPATLPTHSNPHDGIRN